MSFQTPKTLIHLQNINQNIFHETFDQNFDTSKMYKDYKMNPHELETINKH